MKQLKENCEEKNVVRADKMCKIMTHIVIIIAWNFSLMDQTRPGSLKFSQMSEYLPELCKFPHNNRHVCTVNKPSASLHSVYTLRNKRKSK